MAEMGFNINNYICVFNDMILRIAVLLLAYTLYLQCEPSLPTVLHGCVCFYNGPKWTNHTVVLERFCHSTLGLLLCFLGWMSLCSDFGSPLSLSPTSSPSPLSSVSTLLLLEPSFFSWSISFLSWMTPTLPPALCRALIWRRRVGDSFPRNGLLSSGPDSILPLMALTKSMPPHSLSLGWTVLVTEQARILLPLSSPASTVMTRGVTVSLTT